MPAKGAPDLGPMAAHLASIERQTGRRPVARDPFEGIDTADCPEVREYVWDWFVELATRRTGGAVGPNPLSHGELLAWATLTERDLTPEEVRLLMRLDDVALATLREAK